VPLDATGFEQPPVPPSPELHVPARWHVSEATHTTGGPPTHEPPWHESPAVHALPSEQVVPFAAGGLEQTPVLGEHVPATVHSLDAVQVSGLDPTHVPLSH